MGVRVVRVVRAAPACRARRRFGTGDGSAFEAPLRDWSSAELSLAHLEASSGLSVQRPPLAYSEEAARRGAEETGRDWFFSIADFEHALLHGTLEIKPTSRALRAGRHPTRHRPCPLHLPAAHYQPDAGPPSCAPVCHDDRRGPSLAVPR